MGLDWCCVICNMDNHFSCLNIATALKELKHKPALNVEVVVFNDQGLPDFDSLQLYNGRLTPINYCMFDILWLDVYDLREVSIQDWVPAQPD